MKFISLNFNVAKVNVTSLENKGAIRETLENLEALSVHTSNHKNYTCFRTNTSITYALKNEHPLNSLKATLKSFARTL